MSLDPSSVAAANKAFYAKHPDRNGKPITEGEPGFEQLSKEWAELYEQEAAKPPATGSDAGHSSAPTKACDSAQQCPLEKKSEEPPPQKLEPCYYQRFQVFCGHSRIVEFRRTLAGSSDPFSVGGVQSSLPESAKKLLSDRVYEVVAKPEPEDPKDTTTIEIMGNPTGQADQVSIELLGNVGCGKFKHPWITVFDTHTLKWVVDQKGSPKAKFEAKALWVPFPPYKGKGGYVWGMLQLAWYLFWTNNQKRTYLVRADDCPNDPSGNLADKMADFDLTVVAYPSDEYSLKIALKPKYKRKTEKSSLTDKKTNSTTNSTTTTTDKNYTAEFASQQVTSNSSTYYATGGYTVAKSENTTTEKYTGKQGVKSTVATNKAKDMSVGTVESVDEPDAESEGVMSFAEKNFELKRNEKNLFKPSSEDGILEKIRDWVINIQRLLEIVKQFGSIAPKVGWWCDMEFECLSGEIKANWNFKESKDHYVYPYWKVNVALTLFSGSLTVNYGAKVNMKLTKKSSWWGEKEEEEAIEAKIYLKIGGAITASGEKEYAEPAAAIKSEPYAKFGRIEGSVFGELGVQGTVGNGDILKGNANVSLGGKAGGDLFVGSPNIIKIKTYIKRDRIVATLTLEAAWGFIKAKREIELCPEGEELPMGEWPEEVPVDGSASESPKSYGGAGGTW